MSKLTGKCRHQYIIRQFTSDLSQGRPNYDMDGNRLDMNIIDKSWDELSEEQKEELADRDYAPCSDKCNK